MRSICTRFSSRAYYKYDIVHLAEISGDFQQGVFIEVLNLSFLQRGRHPERPVRFPEDIIPFIHIDQIVSAQ